jgi:hypothetical protein
VRLTGYRYLPAIHVDNDTRPAPIPAQGYEDAIAHVRLEMRDPGGVRQVSDDPAALGGRVEICPALTLPDGQVLRGDFAQLYTTLGGDTARPIGDALAVLGAPLGPPAPGPAGDCAPTTVLATERQRLELHPDLDWPFRVSGTQIGAAIFRQRYGEQALQRRTDVAGGAIADPRFKAFFESYGGLPAFGYPIGGLIEERDDATGQVIGVQYFERARFELAPGVAADAPLQQQVRLGALMAEYSGLAAECPGAGPPTELSATPARPRAPAVAAEQQPAPASAAIAPADGRRWWLWAAVGVNLVLLLAIAGWGWSIRAEMQRRRRFEARARRRREAAARAASAEPDYDELLRRLIER